MPASLRTFQRMRLRRGAQAARAAAIRSRSPRMGGEGAGRCTTHPVPHRPGVLTSLYAGGSERQGGEPRMLKRIAMMVLVGTVACSRAGDDFERATPTFDAVAMDMNDTDAAAPAQVAPQDSATQ